MTAFQLFCISSRSEVAGKKVTADAWANIHSNSHFTMSPLGNNTMAVFVGGKKHNKNNMSNYSSSERSGDVTGG